MAYKWMVMLCLMPAITVFMIDSTVVNVALAKLGAVFGVDVATVQWAVTAFSLSLGIATPTASYIETRYTLKRVWVVALSLFTLGSVLCGLAPTFWVLVAGRVVQGITGGILFPMAIAEVFRVFPPNERGAAIGLFAIPVVAGPALGPTFGGYIVTYLDWRLVFFINVPLGVLSVAVAALLLHQGEAEKGHKFDTVGAILSSLAFGCSLYGLSRVSQDGWSSISVRLLIGFGLLNLALFIAYELGREEPLLDVRLFALPQFLVANVVGWVSTVALFGAEFMLPIYLQNLRGLTAMETGMLLLPQGLAVAFSGPIGGRLVDKVGARLVVIVGLLMLTVNTWEMARISLDTSFDSIRWLVFMRGIALGFALQPTKLVALGAVPEALRTNASSLQSAMQSVFQSFGVAILSTVVQTQSVVHTVVMGWQVRPDTIQGAAIGQVSALLQYNGGLTSPAADVTAIYLVLAQISRQASNLAFGDAYHLTFFAALLAIALSLLLPGRGATKSEAASIG